MNLTPDKSFRIASLSIAVSALLGCSSAIEGDAPKQSEVAPQGSAVTATHPSGQSQSAAGAGGTHLPAGVVMTPMGPRDAAKVHAVPNHASVEHDGTVKVDGRVVDKFEPLTSRGATPDVNVSPGTQVANWVESTNTNATNIQGLQYFDSMNANFTVPALPRANDGQLIYLFPSVQNSDSILQPVLQYGNNGSFGGNYWSLAVWLCYSAASGTPCPHSTPITVSAGDQIQSFSVMLAIGGGSQTWQVTAIDTSVAGGPLTTATFNPDSAPYNTAQSAVLEAYNLQSCDDYPGSNTMVFSDVSVTEAGPYFYSDNPVTPTWSTAVASSSQEASLGYPTNCGFNVNAGPAIASLGWAPPDPVASTVSWGPGRLDTFVRGEEDGAIYHKYWNGTAWGPSETSWEDLGGAATGTAEAVSWGEGRLDVFVRGTDDQLYHDAFDSGAWSGWNSLGGFVASHPTVVSWGPNRLDVFVVGPDAHMYHKAFDGNSWSPSTTGWDDLGGEFLGPIKAVSWGPNRIDVFGTGLDAALYHMAWTGSAWWPEGYWQKLGGDVAGAPSVVSWAANRLDIFVTGAADGQLYHSAGDGVNFGGWDPLGGQIAGSPVAAAWGPNRIDIFVTGSQTGDLYHKYWDGSEWGPPSGYDDLGGTPIITSPTVVSSGAGLLDVFVARSDRAIYHKGWNGAWTPSFTGFDDLSGVVSW